MKGRVVGLIAALLLAGPMAAHAVIVTVDDQQWQVTTLLGTWVDLESTLTKQEWYGNKTLAVSFKDQVGDKLGTPNEFSLANVGPFFAYAFNPFGVTPRAEVVMFGRNCDSENSACGVGPATPRTWAVAERVAVPEPATLALLGLGLLGVGAARRRGAN